MLRKLGEYMGTGTANVINLFDAPFIILNGGLVNTGSPLIEPLKKTVEDNRIRHFDRSCKIQISKLGQFAGALGAVMLPLRTYFEFENIKP